MTRIEEIKWKYNRNNPDHIGAFDIEVDVQFLLISLTEMEEKMKELETNLTSICSGGIQDRYLKAEFHLKRLENAIDRHEQWKRTHDRVVALEDEELYQTRKEVTYGE